MQYNVKTYGNLSKIPSRLKINLASGKSKPNELKFLGELLWVQSNDFQLQPAVYQKNLPFEAP